MPIPLEDSAKALATLELLPSPRCLDVERARESLRAWVRRLVGGSRPTPNPRKNERRGR